MADGHCRSAIGWRSAVSIVPNLERSAAVLTGTVLSVRKFVVLTNSGGQKEIWTAAEVRVEHIGKQDTNLSERVFLYFEQDYISENGFSCMRVCPANPKIAKADRKTFYCVGRDAGEGKRVLFIPTDDWIKEPWWPPPLSLGPGEGSAGDEEWRETLNPGNLLHL
jgi:hypothetical protein